MHRMVLLSGSSHPRFADLLADRLGRQVSNVLRGKFANGETHFELLESVRGADVYIVQTHYGQVNDALMELLIMVQTCRYASAHRITAVLPIFPYSRQDKMYEYHQPISAKLVANMLTLAGVHNVLTMQLHTPQVQGFFDIPCDNLSAESSFITWIQRNLADWQEIMLVAPNKGAVKIATSMAYQLGLSIAMMHKEPIQAGSARNMVLVGNVREKVVVVVDDMTDTSRTLCFAAQRLKEAGAAQIYAIITHGIFSDNAVELLSKSSYKLIVVTNTLPQPACVCNNAKFHILDISRIFSDSIRAIHENVSVHQTLGRASTLSSDHDIDLHRRQAATTHSLR